MVINSPCLNNEKELAILDQTTTDKESTNLLMADSFPKTIMPTKLVKPQDFNLRPNLGQKSFKFQEFKRYLSFGEAKATTIWAVKKTLFLPFYACQY
ncbi:hypothetical protein Tco_0077718 [Tanacetum coccineum]